jgi:outer membrane protein assembly factor BamB
MHAASATYAANRHLIWLIGGLLVARLTGSAADWTQYRGPNHDGTSAERINKQWSGSITNPVWLVPVTNGPCSLTVSGGRVFTQIRRAIDDFDKEVCVALSTTNGTELWATTVDDADYPNGGVGFDDGPRSTPSIDGDSVYVLSSYLNLYRLNRNDGGIIWQQDLKAIYGGFPIPWQNAASPLIENGLIYLNANCGVSTLLALHTSDGSLAWRSQNEAMTHSSPVLATIDGVRQVIFATQSGLVSLNPQSGNLLWKFNYPFFYSTSLGASPVVHSNMVFIGGAHAYNMGSVVAQVRFTNNAWTATRLWYTNNPASHWMTPVAYQGYLYGPFGIQFYDATPATQLKCIDMRTGQVQWSVDNFGHGGIMLVDNHLVVITEMGDLVLVKPDPNAYTELGRFQAIPDYFGDTNKCWNSPAFADGRVYVRSTSFLACYDLSMPNLKLERPQLAGANKFQLTARTENGSPIDSNRFAGIEFRTSTNPALPLTQWTMLTNNLVLTNGAVRATNVDGTGFSRRFFIVSEPD